MLLVIFIYQIKHDSGWLTCLMLLWNPPPVVNMGVKAKLYFIIWFLYTLNLDFWGCHAVTLPHLPNYILFWIIIMSSITVTPSTSGQYGGKSQTLTFYPIIGFQYITFHKGIDLKVRVIQCNMVNEDNLWSLKVIQSRWIEFILNSNFTPKLGRMAWLWEHHRPKNLNALALIWYIMPGIECQWRNSSICQISWSLMFCVLDSGATPGPWRRSRCRQWLIV